MYHSKTNYLALILLFFSSCGALKFEDRMISYQYIESANEELVFLGDFQVLPFINGESIFVMPGYFRDLNPQRSLLVRLMVPKKFDFENLLGAHSIEFGDFEFKKKALSHSSDLARYDSSIDLSQLEPETRRNRIEKDTLVLRLGNKSFRFAPARR